MIAVKVVGVVAAPIQVAFAYVRDHEEDQDPRTTFATDILLDNFKILTAFIKLPLPLTNRIAHYGLWKYERVNGVFWALIADNIPTRPIKGYITSHVFRMYDGGVAADGCLQRQDGFLKRSVQLSAKPPCSFTQIWRSKFNWVVSWHLPGLGACLDVK